MMMVGKGIGVAVCGVYEEIGLTFLCVLFINWQFGKACLSIEESTCQIGFSEQKFFSFVIWVSAKISGSTTL